MEVFKLLAVAVAGTLWSAWLALYLREKGVNPMRELLDRFSRLGWVCKVGVLFLVVQLTMFGGAKHGGTNDVDDVAWTNDVEGIGWVNGNGEAESFPLQGEGLRGPFLSGRPSQFLTSGKDSASPLASGETPLPQTDVLSDFTRGYRLECVTTNDDISYAMPSGATVRGTWHMTGAYEDVQKVSLGDFLFPLGTNLCDSLWTYTWGKVRPQLKNTGSEIAAVGAPMSAIPEASRFWTMLTTNDTYLMTWENFALGRISGEAESFPLQNGIAPPLTSGETPLPLVSAQIELNRNGDFITRSNNVESVYRRVIEPNPEPLNPYGPVQDLSVINETNAYCWVDIVVNNADAWVRFEGDGPSNLADPSFAAKAGETNHVVILIGKTYKVTCDMQFSIVGKSDPAIDAWWEDDHTLWLNWPVAIEAWEGNGNSFRMHVDPGCLGGTFVWTESNCPLSGSGLFFSYSCDTNSPCSGCAAKGYYDYEGYAKDCIGGWCGCNYVPEEPEVLESEPDDGPYAGGAAVSFSDAAVIFEDGYVNMPGEFVPRQSTRTTLSCVAHGGPNGGTATFSISGDDKLVRVSGRSLPVTVTVPPEQKVAFEVVYEGQEPSERERDIVATATFTEDDGEPSTDDAFLTAVKVELEAVYEAPGNSSQSRHVYGVGERVKFKVVPVVVGATLKVAKTDAGDNVTDYDTFGGETELDAGTENVYTCPAAGTVPVVTLQCAGVEYAPEMTVVEPQSVEALSVTSEGTFWPGDVCMGVMVSRVCVKPFTVSFSGVQIYEIPCTNAIPPTGYFDSDYYKGPKTHVYPNAGYLHIPDEDNYVMTDRAGRTDPYTNWFAGTLTWKVPIGWRRIRRGYENQLATDEIDYACHRDKDSRPLFIGGGEDAYTQTFEIEADGTSSVRKFGYKLERNRWLPIGFVSQTGEDE